MSILVDQNTRLLCQGMTGWAGTYHTNRMIQYGTKVVAGVTPGKGGKSHLDVPIFDSVAEAVRTTGANASAQPTVHVVPAKERSPSLVLAPLLPGHPPQWVEGCHRRRRGEVRQSVTDYRGALPLSSRRLPACGYGCRREPTATGGE